VRARVNESIKFIQNFLIKNLAKISYISQNKVYSKLFNRKLSQNFFSTTNLVIIKTCSLERALWMSFLLLLAAF